MSDYKRISNEIKEGLGMQFDPVGVCFSDRIPGDAMHFKKESRGCIAPLIFKSARGRVVAFDRPATGLPCASFYLGYSEWIFPGIEKFLSNENVNGREPERFVPGKMRDNVIIFKPLGLFTESEKPELVLFFVHADQLSALVFLIGYGAPLEERIVTRFASACMSMFTLPLKYAEAGEKKAVWGFHDVSARKRLPRDLMTLTLTYDLFIEVVEHLGESFIQTETWDDLRKRNS
jgi:hypothetical protein